jgi:HTH-type transcriptional regulator/antitoxin HipB
LILYPRGYILDLMGIKQATVSAFENRPENTKMDTVFRILAAVNLDIYCLGKNEVLAGKNEWKEEW